MHTSRRWTYRRSVLLAALVLGMASASLAAGDVVITAVAGKVEHRAKATAGWSASRVGVSLPSGAQLRTAKDSKAELRFPDGTTFRLGPESQINLVAPSPPTAQVPKGSLFARIIKGSLVRIQGKYGAAAVRGTQLLYSTSGEGESLRAWEGSVDYSTPGGTINVPPGMGTTLAATKPGTAAPAVEPMDRSEGILLSRIRELRAHQCETLGLDPPTVDAFLVEMVQTGAVEDAAVLEFLRDKARSTDQLVADNANKLLRALEERPQAALPSPPQPVAPPQFSGVQYMPFWEQVRSGVQMDVTEGTPAQRVQMGQRSDLGQALLQTEPGRIRTGNLAVELSQVRTAQAQAPLRGPGTASLPTVAAALAAATVPSRASTPTLERRISDWLWGPVGGFGAYGVLSDEASIAGGRAKVSFVARDLYLQAAGRVTAQTDLKPDWSLDETFIAYRGRDAEAAGGRIRLLEGPASNSDVGSLLPFTTVDGVRLSGWLGRNWHATAAWLGDYDSVTRSDLTGGYARLQYFVGGGWLGVSGLMEKDEDLGVTGSFAFPLFPDKVTAYGEFGDDPTGRHIETFGISFPGLWYDHDLNIHVERATRGGYDTLTSLHAYWGLHDNLSLLGVVAHSEKSGNAFGIGLLASLEGL